MRTLLRPKAEKTDQTALYRSINSNAKKYKCEKCPLSKTSNLYSKTYIHFKIDLPAHVMYPNALPKIVSGRRCVLTVHVLFCLATFTGYVRTSTQNVCMLTRIQWYTLYTCMRTCTCASVCIYTSMYNTVFNFYIRIHIYRP